jgi:hypothetical protein
VWESRFDSPNGSALARAIALDKSGGINVTGCAPGLDGTLDFATVKYDNLGHEQWTSWYASSTPLDDMPISIAADSTGRVYVTGDIIVDKSSFYWISQPVTVKYTSTGAEEWRTPYEGPPGSRSFAYKVVLDNSGNVYVGGLLQTASFAVKYLTIRYNAAGFSDWAVTFGDDGSQCFQADMALDMNGNAYVWGVSYLLIGAANIGAMMVKYGPNGDLQGSATIQGLNGAELLARTLAVDHNGDVILTGTTAGFTWSIMSAYKLHEIATSTDEDAAPIPLQISLEQNYPNPFNPSATIRYGLPARSRVTLTVFNTLGQQVATLVEGEMEAGYHEAKFEASALASGMYLYRLAAGDYVQTRKALLLR